MRYKIQEKKEGTSHQRLFKCLHRWTNLKFSLKVVDIKLEPEKDGDFSYDQQVYDPHDLDYESYANSIANREKLTIQHREEVRHLDKNLPPVEAREDKVAKDIIGAYKKFGIENANPTRAIMRRTGVDIAKATQLVH